MRYASKDSQNSHFGQVLHHASGLNLSCLQRQGKSVTSNTVWRKTKKLLVTWFLSVTVDRAQDKVKRHVKEDSGHWAQYNRPQGLGVG